MARQYQHERTAARKCAVQILYAGTIRGASAIELLKSGDMGCLDAEVSDYAYKLVEGVENHKAEIDDRLSSISRNWSIDRMPIMDLAILRTALFEMLYVDVVPVSVSINEAVELSKSFGGDDDSPKFINGMLGNVARQLEGQVAFLDIEYSQDLPDIADASDACDVEDDSGE